MKEDKDEPISKGYLMANSQNEKYEITYNQLSEENKKSLINNKIINVKERFIRINNVFGVFDNYTEKLFF